MKHIAKRLGNKNIHCSCTLLLCYFLSLSVIKVSLVLSFICFPRWIKSSFSFSPFFFHFFLHASLPFFFPIVFSTNSFSIKHSLSTYYAPISCARMCETQSCPWRSLSSTKGERHIMKLLLKENTYTLEMCPKYREMKERVIHLEESGGWEKDAWRRISRALSSQCREMGWPVSMRPHSILEECQAFLEEKEHPLPGRVEYLWRQLSIHNINGSVFFSLGLCCTWIDGNDHLKVNVSMGKTKEKNFN